MNSIVDVVNTEKYLVMKWEFGLGVLDRERLGWVHPIGRGLGFILSGSEWNGFIQYPPHPNPFLLGDELLVMQ
jgi:hypothetical protein